MSGTKGGGVDRLSCEHRDFYEHAVWKNIISIMHFGTSLLFMGFVSQFGGRANWGRNYTQASSVTSLSDKSLFTTYKAVMDGYGFATFCFFCAFVLALSSSMYISPYITGSPQEKMILRDPDNFEKHINDLNKQKLEGLQNNLP